tara:strand:+ start:2085 stop:2273 length:189 start_codon:yes stop_codon:yes gene_type:complete
MSISPLDAERLTHINHVMGQLHDHMDNIYEHLVDRDISECVKEVEESLTKLKDLKYSLGDGV